MPYALCLMPYAICHAREKKNPEFWNFKFGLEIQSWKKWGKFEIWS
jgi:hypothetical protein